MSAECVFNCRHRCHAARLHQFFIHTIAIILLSEHYILLIEMFRQKNSKQILRNFYAHNINSLQLDFEALIVYFDICL